MPLIVKICGITRPEDAEAAVSAGADWIGLNFWPRSRRHVTIERAQEIAAVVPGDVKKVGVFVNAPARAVEDTARRVGLDRVQLHGDEDPEYCAAFAGRYLRAVRMAAPGDLEELARFATTDTFLLDAPSAGYGGSGRTFDWALARAAKAPGRKIIVAGGLTPENVAQAVREVRPFGVDVAGGVESTPGVKDPDKLRRFVDAARGLETR